ncbi:DUF58 domain-containing protein [Pontibacter cellulosilyticus]|uniref:DUF58 domain-containing protein n=1 Tax=Pontibacter cellulosilyticus TaxID=1720253 RepID=A0A923N327_9BACT|nr:DUF58 domain-containing protein [Pontibacter cellulosilyticus]MBC5991338.1 DUF58 domain-containing protein [Pontibacter cellulosilyticus]
MKKPLTLADVQKFENMEFLAKQLVEGFITGLHQSPYHGFSVEFSEHRLYNSGESTRHIDWKVFARTDKLFVKRYEEETNLRCHILLDVSPSMYYPTENNGKLTFSILCAGALATLLRKQRDAIGLVTFSDKIELQTPVRSTASHLHTLLLLLQKQLEQQPTAKDTNVSEVVHQIAQQIQKRSLVIIFSDMLSKLDDSEAIFSALQHLKHQKHEVLIFHVMDKKTEEEFSFAERPYIFVDSETGQELKLQPSQVRDHYRNAVESYKKELSLKCGQYKIDFVPVDISEPFDRVLYSYLIKRAKVR